MFWLHLEPEENDWRLDPWEARNVGFSMELQVKRADHVDYAHIQRCFIES